MVGNQSLQMVLIGTTQPADGSAEAQVYGTSLKNMMERFVQYLKKDRTEYSMIIFHVKRRIAIYAACVELAENVSTVSEYVC